MPFFHRVTPLASHHATHQIHQITRTPSGLRDDQTGSDQHSSARPQAVAPLEVQNTHRDRYEIADALRPLK